MNKSQKIKKAARNTCKQNIKQWFKKVLSYPVRAIKWLWNLLCRICRAIWNWLKSIDIVGMINLTLLVAIIVLFLSLITDFVRCNKCEKSANANKPNVVMMQKENNDNRRVVQRKFSTTLPVQPVKIDEKTTITPKIRTIGVKKPEIVRELSVPANEFPQQTLSGEVIVERGSNAPVLSNGVKVNGNLYIQNMNKYTIPCDAKINGHLFIRNVNKVNFCGKFKVNGNVYVNRESSFGPLPAGTKINGQIIL